MKKQFKLNQSVLWTVNDFDGRMVTNAVITEVHDNYCIAKSDDNMTLWIDNDNEMEFFETDIMEKLSNVL